MTNVTPIFFAENAEAEAYILGQVLEPFPAPCHVASLPQ